MKIQKILNFGSILSLTIIIFAFISVFGVGRVNAAKNGMQGNLKTDAEAQRETGTGNQPSKSQTDPAQNEKPPIQNKDRDKWADCDGRTDPKKCLKDNPLVIWTLKAINFLAAGVGIIVTIMIIIGGIQYASAGSNPQAVQAAKHKIANAIIALLAFFFLYAFMQWLIPGGMF